MRGHFLAIVGHLGNGLPGPFHRYSEWPCNVLQTFYRGGQRSAGGASRRGMADDFDR